MHQYHRIIPLTCAGRSSEVLLGAGREFCLWKVQLRISGAATVTIGAVVPGCCVVLWVRSLVLCQDLAGSWDAWHECGAVNARVQWSQWLSDSEEGVVAQTRQRMRGKQ